MHFWIYKCTICLHNLKLLLRWSKPNLMADLWVRAEGHFPCRPPLPPPPLIRAAGPRLVLEVCCWKQNKAKQTEGGALLCHHWYKHNNHLHTREVRVANICLMLSKCVHVYTNTDKLQAAFVSLSFSATPSKIDLFENTCAFLCERWIQNFVLSCDLRCLVVLWESSLSVENKALKMLKRHLVEFILTMDQIIMYNLEGVAHSQESS